MSEREPVTREAVERWLLAHGWKSDDSVCDSDFYARPIRWWRPGPAERRFTNLTVADEGVVIRTVLFSYFLVDITEHGIYGRIA